MLQLAGGAAGGLGSSDANAAAMLNPAAIASPGAARAAWPIASRHRSVALIPVALASSSSWRLRSGCSLISNRVVGSFFMRPRYDHQPSFLSTHRRSDGVPTRRKGRGNYAAAKKEPRQEPRLRLC